METGFPRKTQRGHTYPPPVNELYSLVLCTVRHKDCLSKSGYPDELYLDQEYLEGQTKKELNRYN